MSSSSVVIALRNQHCRRSCGNAICGETSSTGDPLTSEEIQDCRHLSVLGERSDNDIDQLIVDRMKRGCHWRTDPLKTLLKRGNGILEVAKRGGVSTCVPGGNAYFFCVEHLSLQSRKVLTGTNAV